MKRGAILVLIAALSLAGCLKKAPDQVPDEGLDAIANAVEDQLNAPVVSILALLRQADEAHRVTWADLAIGFDGRQIPVNWWLYRKGFVELSGANQVGSGAYLLSPKTTDLLMQPDQDWFEVEQDDPTRVDCSSPAAQGAGGCEVDIAFTPKLTPAGQQSGAGRPGRATVTALVALSDSNEWQVVSLAPQGTVSLHNLALDAILGPEDSRPAAMEAADKELRGQAQAMEPAPLSSSASLPPLYEPPPVAPAAPTVPDYVAGRRVTP